MQLTSSSITAVQKVITGDQLEHLDKAIAPYRPMSKIQAFFGSIPGLHTIWSHDETRWRYVEAVLREFNGGPELENVVEEAANPAHFQQTEFPVEEAVEYMNGFLLYDGYRLRREGRRFKVVEVGDEPTGLVIPDTPQSQPEALSSEAIQGQMNKAQDRLSQSDFEGAITVARTLVETVLTELHQRLSDDPIDAKGNLLKLYKNVPRDLNLDPEEHDVAALQKILRGLTSIVAGIGDLRNRMSDAHPKQFVPRRHHAVLAINAANTLVWFLFATREYQEVLARERESS